jgi:hypothetical protein
MPVTVSREGSVLKADLDPEDFLDLSTGTDVTEISVSIGGEAVMTFYRVE